MGYTVPRNDRSYCGIRNGAGATPNGKRPTSRKGRLTMPTTILAYVIAVLGFVMIVGGVYSFFDLWNERAPLRHYAISIGIICGGFAMGGIAQALRVLVAIAHAIQTLQ
jgi:hypothetical protein